MQEDEEVPEVSEAEELLSAYARIKKLLGGFESESSEWSNALYDELNDPIKSNLLNKINVYDRDAEFFELLRSVDPARDRSGEFEIRAELLDPFKLDNEFDALMNSVEVAKVKSVCRGERLQDSFRKLKIAQQGVVDRIVQKLKNEAGLTRIEIKAAENNELIDRLKQSLLEKNETIAANNREKELTANELRLKYESQIEDKIRDMMQTIESKTRELGGVTSTQGRLKSEYSNLQNSLGMLLRELDSEEKASAMEAQIAINPVARFRASIYRNAASKGTSTNLFGDMSSGTITKELVSDSQRALNEAFEKQKELYQAITASEERTQNLRKELSQVIQSEENKALDRLKKVCDNLQVKIQSDEQRVKVMAALVNQIQKGDDSVHRSASQKIRSSDGTTIILDKHGSAGGVHRHSQRGLKKSKSKDKPEATLGTNANTANDILPQPELMGLLPDAHDRHRESISMKMHRRLYAQYFVEPVDTVKENSSDSESNAKETVITASKKHSKKMELPRKRRITSSQSGKIQKIMDMMSAQLAKLSAVKDEDIKHIFDYRAFPDDAERMQTSHSSASGISAMSGLSGGSRSQKRQLQEQLLQEQGETTLDHTKMLHGGSSPRHGLTPRPPGSRQSSRGLDQASILSSTSEDHLRIPVTADLEDRNDAEFYAQNYGIKLALEHLTAFLEVLTSGQSSDTAFMRGDSQSGKGKHKKIHIPGDEREELQTVEGLRGNINTLIALIRELHFLSQSNKNLCKDLHKEVDNKLKECDRLRSDLLQEVEGAHWPQATRAGQYELGIEQSKEKLRVLKVEVKQWEQRVSIKRAQNIRLSQVVANTSTRRASIVHKLDPHSEEILKPRKKYVPPVAGHPPLTKPNSPIKSDLVKEEPEPPLVVEATRAPGQYNFSVANQRMDLFDDMSNIYDSAIRSIKLSAAPLEPPNAASEGAEKFTESSLPANNEQTEREPTL